MDLLPSDAEIFKDLEERLSHPHDNILFGNLKIKFFFDRMAITHFFSVDDPIQQDAYNKFSNELREIQISFGEDMEIAKRRIHAASALIPVVLACVYYKTGIPETWILGVHGVAAVAGLYGLKRHLVKGSADDHRERLKQLEPHGSLYQCAVLAYKDSMRSKGAS